MRFILFASMLANVLTGAIGAELVLPRTPRQTIDLAGVEGRIDHLAVDLQGRRLFVAALGNNTAEVIDLAAGKRARSIPGLREPQGIAFLSAANRIVVASAGDGSCRVFDGQTYGQVALVDCKEDADNVRYDAASGLVYVGYGSGALAAIDPRQAKRLGDVPLAGHPESFQLETRGKWIFVNVPTARQVAVVDREQRAVIATWPIESAEANFPMALDEAHRRLFIACRKPARMLAIDIADGKCVASTPCAGDADDLYYDAKTKRVYVIGGEGSVSVIQQIDADHYRPLGAIPTAPGARTGFFVPSNNRLYIAVPHRGAQKAEIRVYELGG